MLGKIIISVTAFCFVLIIEVVSADTIPHGVRNSSQVIDDSIYHYAKHRLIGDTIEGTKKLILNSYEIGKDCLGWFSTGGMAAYTGFLSSGYGLIVGGAACALYYGGSEVFTAPFSTVSNLYSNLPSLEQIRKDPKGAVRHTLNKTNLSHVYQDGIYLTGVGAYVNDAGNYLKWKVGSGVDRYTIDDDNGNISQVANITLNIPPVSKSKLQAGINNISSVPDFLRFRNEWKVSSLSNKVAYWDIEKPDSKWPILKYLSAKAQSIAGALLRNIGINLGGDSYPFITEIKKVVSLLKDGQTLRVFFSEYPEGVMALKFAVLKKEFSWFWARNESITESTPLLTIPLKSVDNIDSLSDRLAYESDSTEAVYSGLAFLSNMVQALQTCGITSEYEQVVLSDCNPDVSATIDFRNEKPAHIVSVRTVNMIGIPGINLWVAKNIYDSNGGRAPDIHTSFGEGEWQITNSGAQMEHEKLLREQILSTAIINKTLKGLGKSY